MKKLVPVFIFTSVMKDACFIRRTYVFVVVQMKFLLVITLIIQIQVFILVSAGYDDFMTDSNHSQVAVNRIKRAQRARPTCTQPPVTPDKNYLVRLSFKDEPTDAKPGQTVPENAIISAQCNKGYALDYESVESHEAVSICKNDSWHPTILKCKKICMNFSTFLNFNMTCEKYFGGPKIPCVGLLLEEAVVKLRCRQKFRPDRNVDYDYATCREDGNWNKEFYKCEPECGAVASDAESLIANGELEKRGGAPWNLVIYSTDMSPQKPKFICGGTLINAELAISAAHCFYNDAFRKKMDVGLFYAVVAKATPDFNVTDYPGITKTYRLRDIYYSDVITFEGSNTNYVGDIVILQLSQNVDFSSDVFPACLDWDKRDLFYPGENITGKISGFGAEKDGTFPRQLLTANLPYIGYDECKKKVRDGFRKSITTDRFCAGSKEGSGARRGDSGGGLLFMDEATGLYHLRGVVSIKDFSDSSIATFTDIAQYMHWILRTMKNIEYERKSCRCNPDGSLRGSCDSITGKCQCKAFVTGTKCDTCRDGYWKLGADYSDGCVACGCTSNGSSSSTCNKMDGSCKCKPGVIGSQCDECSDQGKVMRSNECVDLNWVKFSQGNICLNAVGLHNATDKSDTSLIARHQSTHKLASIPRSGSTSQFSEYEVLCEDLVKWVKVESGPVPHGAFVTHWDEVNGPYSGAWYICQTIVYPGHSGFGMVKPDGICSTGGMYGSSESIHGLNLFGYMVPRNAKDGLQWVKFSHREKCSNAVVIDTSQIGPRLVIRYRNNASSGSGIFINSTYTINTPWWDVTELPVKDYEMLCGEFEKLDYPSMRGPFAPLGAVVHRKEEAARYKGKYYESIFDTYYICRALADDGSMVLGERLDRVDPCIISHGGREIRRLPNQYDILVISG